MLINQFLDRDKELERITNALRREQPQFIVLYGRRRIGKSTLLREVLSRQQDAVYFLADRTSEVHQRMLFAQAASTVVPDFGKATYPDWETMLRALSRQIEHRMAVCLDEFPYLVKSCPALPSIIQKLLNERVLRYDLIICGSAQQQMHDIVLNKTEPLYGLADEIIKIRPISPHYIQQALGCSVEDAVEEYTVWGGVPRYWEIRKDYPTMMAAIRAQMLDLNGFLMDEPERLLKDDMRDSVQPETLLSIIGNGANRLSEIASRAGREASQISEPLTRLRELGYVEREIPWGEDEKKSKRGVYHIADQLFAFLYKFVIPHRSILQLGRVDTVAQIISQGMSQHVGHCWEKLCREHVSGNVIDGVTYNMAGRWWGKIFPDGNKQGEMVEVDVVAQSLDRKHILIGECKWTEGEDAHRLMARLDYIKQHLPFIKASQQVHYVLMLKHTPLHADQYPGQILTPQEILLS